MSQLDDSLVNRAAAPGSMRYFSLLYAPEAKREAIRALYVIDAEIRQSAQNASHDVAHTRLQWWRAEVDRLVNGNPQHPATRVLQESSTGGLGALAKLHEPLVAADMDLARMTYSNQQELRAYCSRSGGAITELIAAQLADPEPLEETTRAAANRIGIGVRESEILRDLRQDACEGRIYLPLDELKRNGVEVDALRSREVVPQLREALTSFRRAASADLQPPEAARRNGALRPLCVLAALHARLLDRIAKRHY
ncbi:MAG: squalene/phytoene synthase family protein, partial [Steroidobacteraceae bacterium]